LKIKEHSLFSYTEKNLVWEKKERKWRNSSSGSYFLSKHKKSEVFPIRRGNPARKSQRKKGHGGRGRRSRGGRPALVEGSKVRQRGGDRSNQIGPARRERMRSAGRKEGTGFPLRLGGRARLGGGRPGENFDEKIRGRLRKTTAKTRDRGGELGKARRLGKKANGTQGPEKTERERRVSGRNPPQKSRHNPEPGKGASASGLHDIRAAIKRVKRMETREGGGDIRTKKSASRGEQTPSEERTKKWMVFEAVPNNRVKGKKGLTGPGNRTATVRKPERGKRVFPFKRGNAPIGLGRKHGVIRVVEKGHSKAEKKYPCCWEGFTANAFCKGRGAEKEKKRPRLGGGKDDGYLWGPSGKKTREKKKTGYRQEKKPPARPGGPAPSGGKRGVKNKDNNQLMRS